MRHNNPNAADGRKLLVLIQELSTAADWERYTNLPNMCYK
jgi:hypothetical protein